MATQGTQPNTPPPPKESEEEVDYMKDAPPERPYAKAVTDEQRAAMEAAGLTVEG